MTGDRMLADHERGGDRAVALSGGDEAQDLELAGCETMGVGGRQQRTEAVYGNIYDHFSITYEFANGIRAFSQCRQMGNCATDVSDHLFGTKGKCNIMKNEIDGETKYRFKGRKGNMYVDEHRALFESIRQSKPINNGEYMAKSTMMAIMGREACYTGQTVTWDQALNSETRLGPETYAWGEAPKTAVAMPGQTKFA